MNNDSENKNSSPDYKNALQDGMNRTLQMGILKAINNAVYLIAMGFSLLILTIGIGFCSVHFSFITAIITILFVIFILFTSYRIEKRSAYYMLKIHKKEEDILSFYETVKKDQ